MFIKRNKNISFFQASYDHCKIRVEKSHSDIMFQVFFPGENAQQDRNLKLPTQPDKVIWFPFTTIYLNLPDLITKKIRCKNHHHENNSNITNTCTWLEVSILIIVLVLSHLRPAFRTHLCAYYKLCSLSVQQCKNVFTSIIFKYNYNMHYLSYVPGLGQHVQEVSNAIDAFLSFIYKTGLLNFIYMYSITLNMRELMISIIESLRNVGLAHHYAYILFCILCSRWLYRV